MKKTMKHGNCPGPSCRRCRGQESEIIHRSLTIALCGATPGYQSALAELTTRLGTPWHMANYPEDTVRQSRDRGGEKTSPSASLPDGHSPTREYRNPIGSAEKPPRHEARGEYKKSSPLAKIGEDSSTELLIENINNTTPQLQPSNTPTLHHSTTPSPPLPTPPPLRTPHSALRTSSAPLPPPDLLLLVNQPPVPNSNGSSTPDALPTAILRLKLEHPNLPILLHSPALDNATLIRAIGAGASGWLRQPPNQDEFQCAVCTTLRTGFWLSQEAQGLLLSLLHRCLAFAISPIHLTNREIEIISLLAQGKTLKEIPAVLGNMKEGTLHTHMARLYSKLEVHCWQEVWPKYLRLSILNQSSA